MKKKKTKSEEPYIQIVKIVDDPDGGATVTVEMNGAACMVFIKVGLLKAITDSIEGKQ